MGDMWDLRSPMLFVTLLVVDRTDDDRGTLYACTADRALWAVDGA
jgi:hypothetical protein